MLKVPASITIESGKRKDKSANKSKNKLIYEKKFRKAVLRISSTHFTKNLIKKSRNQKRVDVKFQKRKDTWTINIKRNSKNGNIVQAYCGNHPHLQLVLNKRLPQELWNKHKKSKRKTITLPVEVRLNLSEWKDMNLQPHHFLMEVEKDARTLLKKAIKLGFRANFVPKGREYDLELSSPKGNDFLFAVSKHKAKSDSRTKEKLKQKILMDISKMIPTLHKRKAIPIIVSPPIEFKGSWSFVRNDYLKFYKDKLNFNFITTEFKKEWENDVLRQVLEIDKNVRASKNRNRNPRILGQKQNF